MANQEIRAVNNCQSAPGLTYGSVSNTKVKIANTTFFKVNGQIFYVTSQEIPLLGATVGETPMPNGSAPVAGTLAGDDGTVPVTTNSCRMYTIVATFTGGGTDAAAVTCSAIAGQDFPKHRQATSADIASPSQSNQVEIGWVSIKNEQTGPVVFTPGTTALTGVSGLTVTFRDNYAQSGQ